MHFESNQTRTMSLTEALVVCLICHIALSFHQISPFPTPTHPQTGKGKVLTIPLGLPCCPWSSDLDFFPLYNQMSTQYRVEYRVF